MFQLASSPAPAAPTADPLMTAEELFRLSDDGWLHALVRGELQRRTLAGFRHGTVSTNVVMSLAHHVKTRRLGVVCGAGTGFVLARNPDTVLAPDVAFIRCERIPASGLPATFWEGAPDLAGEVTSPGDTGPAVAEKGVVALGRHARGLGRGPAPGVGHDLMSRAQPPVAWRCRKCWMAPRGFPQSASRSPTSSRSHQRPQDGSGRSRGACAAPGRGPPHRRPSSSRASSHGASNARPRWNARGRERRFGSPTRSWTSSSATKLG